MLTIELKDVRFRAYHGVYPEEKVLGGDFVVNIHVSFLPVQGVITRLDETLDYETLFQIARVRMEEPTPLIETVAMFIAADIGEAFPFLKQYSVRIEKMNPPITGFKGSVAVETRWPSPEFGKG